MPWQPLAPPWELAWLPELVLEPPLVQLPRAPLVRVQPPELEQVQQLEGPLGPWLEQALPVPQSGQEPGLLELPEPPLAQKPPARPCPTECPTPTGRSGPADLLRLPE